MQDNVLAALPDGVIGIDRDQRIAFVNGTAEHIFGYAAAELIGKPLNVLLTQAWRARHPHLASRFLASVDDARLMHERRPVEGLRSDGLTFPAEVTLVKGRDGLKALTFAIIRDVSNEQQRQAELRASEQRLREALREAEASVQAKRIFLANMTHELRTPLNAIIGFAELIEREIYRPHSNPAYKEYGTLIRSGGLLSIVNDLLDLSSFEMGKVQLHEEPVHISEVAADCKQMLVPTLQKAGLRLDLNVPSSLVIRADKRAVKQMLLNLVANSIKFTQAGGYVAVTAALEEGQPIITVRDSGRGIPAERLERITEPFGEQGKDYRRRNGGTGIGLSITKGSMERHGGLLEIESAVGKGTEVRLRFPRQSAVEPEANDCS